MTDKENKWAWFGVTVDKAGWGNVVAGFMVPMWFIILQEVFSSFPSEAFPSSQKKNNPEDGGGVILFVFLISSCTIFYDWKSVAGLFMIIVVGFRIMLAYSLKYFFLTWEKHKH